MLCFANIWHSHFILNDKADEGGGQLKFHLPIDSLYYYLSLCKNFREMIPAFGIIRLLIIVLISKCVLWTLHTFNFMGSTFRKPSHISQTLTSRMTISLESERMVRLHSPKQKGVNGVFTDPGGWFLEVPLFLSGVQGVKRAGLEALCPLQPQYHRLWI